MPTGPFTSHLVTPPPPTRRPAHALQSLAAASSLVTAKEPISEAAQGLAPASSLVTRASLAAVLAHIPDSPRATLELGSRAAGRRSTAGSPALRATAFGSLACSPGGTLVWSNISAGHGCADRLKTALGSRGIDVVLFFSQGQVLLTRIMPITAAAAARPPRPAVHGPGRPLAGPADELSDAGSACAPWFRSQIDQPPGVSAAVFPVTMPAAHRERYYASSPKPFTLNLEPPFTFRWSRCSRRPGNPDHHQPEYATVQHRNINHSSDYYATH